MKTPAIYLKRGREASLERFHPWIFSGAVAQKRGAPAEGAVVDVYTADGNYVGTGHYQEGSIAVRILSFEGPGLPPDFWVEALKKAYALRERLGLCGESESCRESDRRSKTTAYRLVHGEGDHLPGLVIDYYQGVAVMQAHSAGIFMAKTEIAEALKTLYGKELLAIFDKSAGTAPFKAGLPLQNGYLFDARHPSAASPLLGNDACNSLPSAASHDVEIDTCNSLPSAAFTVWENGYRYLPDWEEGQKTGFFLDQRENRALLGQMASGARVLNLFCYSGGFSVSALGGGAESVYSVDSSQRAVELLQQNVAMNFPSDNRHHAITADAFEFLKASPKGAYSLMVLDPPAFAKHTQAKKSALQAYKRLNAIALDRIASRGILFTFSCSQVVDKNEFTLSVFSAAAISGRKVRILHRLGQAPDHPVNIFHPEGDYLKGLVLYVE